MIYTTTELQFFNKINSKEKKQNFLSRILKLKKTSENDIVPIGLSISEKRDFLAISAKDR